MKAQYTFPEWKEKAVRLFGTDQNNWRFICPACKRPSSATEAIEKYGREKLMGWRPEQECLGRYIPEIDCDWCSYGLFLGPAFVELPGGKDRVPVFHFALPAEELQGKPE